MSNDIEPSACRNNILSLADCFIEQMGIIRNTLRGMSISALILPPFAIGLAIYLISHPLFFNVLQTENEFGSVLSILISSVIGISAVCIVTGIRQYSLIDSWNKRYQSFIVRKEEIDKKIADGFALDNGIEES